MGKTTENIGAGRGLLALSPIVVFLALYLSVSLAVGDFYKMPLSLAFIVASVWALFTTHGVQGVVRRIDIFSKGAANGNILYMIWIFILAGAFSALATAIGSVDATVNVTLSVLPASLILPGLFVVSCFVSMSIGTSVGTIVALAPFACQVSQSTGCDAALMVGAVLGGAFFGDNLSFISDTTIAATRSQRVEMKDKFRANLFIAVPAAIVALAVYVVLGATDGGMTNAPNTQHWPMMMPYLVVIVLAACGVNVLVVLLTGIVSCLVLALWGSTLPMLDACTAMGKGIEGMSDLIIVTLLASGLLAVIRHNGGIDYVISVLTRRIGGSRGAMASIAALVAIVNVCTANNTIAIITVGDIARKVSQSFSLVPRRVASVLDTSSCIVQSVLPYGAQALLAAGMAKVSPVSFVPYAVYPAALTIMVVVTIVVKDRKTTI